MVSKSLLKQSKEIVKKSEAFAKLCDVIKSCESEDQLLVACKYRHNYNRLYSISTPEFYELSNLEAIKYVELKNKMFNDFKKRGNDTKGS